MNRTCLLTVAALALVVAACGDDETGGGTVDGTGYSFTMPEDWEDAGDLGEELSDEVDERLPTDLGAAYDAVVVAPPVNGFSPNINVVAEPSIASDFGSKAYSEAAVQLLSNPKAIDRLFPEDFEVVEGPSDLERVEVDGAAAYSSDYVTETLARRLEQRLVGVVHDGTAYTVTFTALEEGFESEVQALDELLSSWRWE